MEIVRGEIYYADLSPVIGSEQGGVRPFWLSKTMLGINIVPQLLFQQ